MEFGFGVLQNLEMGALVALAREDKARLKNSLLDLQEETDCYDTSLHFKLNGEFEHV